MHFIKLNMFKKIPVGIAAIGLIGETEAVKISQTQKWNPDMNVEPSEDSNVMVEETLSRKHHKKHHKKGKKHHHHHEDEFKNTFA